MERIRIPKAKVVCYRRGNSVRGDLHLTQYHLIFRYPRSTSNNSFGETWIAYPMINFCTYRPSSPSSLHPAAIRLRCRDFTYLTFHFESNTEAREVFDNIKLLNCKLGSIERLYAFYYEPTPSEMDFNGWKLYDPIVEFARMGISTSYFKTAVAEPSRGWRISTINSTYDYCPTYPAYLCVPSIVSDTTLRHAAAFRSKCRIPVLTYKHALNDCTITRSAQPNVGVKLSQKFGIGSSRNPQDEKLVSAIFNATKPCALPPKELEDGPERISIVNPEVPTHTSAMDDVITVSLSDTSSSIKNVPKIYGAQQRNMIYDARRMINAVANHAIGYGFENMDFYKDSSIAFLGIENIHVMRASLASVIDAIKDSDLTNLPPDIHTLDKSKWKKHIGGLLEGAKKIASTIAISHSNVLIHCSDGWDRTSQLSALSQLCLDPYYRTIDGFIVLIEKDWVSFGHMFRHRSGLLGHEKWFEVENENTVAARNEDDGSQDLDHLNPFESVISRAQNFFLRKRAPGEEDTEGNNHHTDSSTKPLNHDSDTKVNETSPIFHQFLDATYQLLRQFPTKFEFNERFLRRLLYHLYSCQYGTFLCNSEKEREEIGAKKKTKSVWAYFLSRKSEFVSATYDSEINEDIREKASLLLANEQDIRWWFELFGRTDKEMNGPGNFPLVVTEDNLKESNDEEDISLLGNSQTYNMEVGQPED